MKPRTLASWILPLLGLLAAAWAASQSVLLEGPSRMSDALPLYLYGGAFELGLSPVDGTNLQQVYSERGLRVGAALWSTLYPATAAPWMWPLAKLSWDGFTTAWGWLLLLSSLGVGVLVPSPRAQSWEDRRLLGGAGLLLAGLFHPTAEAARLGQINAFLALLSAGALVLVLQRRGLLAGLLLGLGACLKLVPVFLAVPLVLGRRWKVAAGGLLIGLPTLALTFTLLSPAEFVQALQETADFQDSVAPAWMNVDLVPGWVLWLGDLRHRGLMWASLALASGLALWRPSKGVLAGGALLLLAWLGTDASAFHILYAPLYLPALVWAATWPLDREAPAWSWGPALLLAIAASTLPREALWFEDASVSCVLLGYLVWLAVLLRAGHEALVSQPVMGPVQALVERWPLPVAGLSGLVVSLLLFMPRADTTLPDPDSVVVMPDGEIRRTGTGFLDPGTAPPGAMDTPEHTGQSVGSHSPGQSPATRRWPEMGPQGSLEKGSRRAVSVHLKSAAWRWEQLAEAQPQHAESARALAAWVPSEDLQQVEVGHLARFLAAEGVLLAELDGGQLEADWEKAVYPD